MIPELSNYLNAIFFIFNSDGILWYFSKKKNFFEDDCPAIKK